MAHNTIYFRHPILESVKAAPVGFSWTVLFFGPFPALFRSDWKWFLIIFICALVTWGFSSLVFMFIYNKLYIKDLLAQGYKAENVANGDVQFVSSQIGVPLPQLEPAA